MREFLRETQTREPDSCEDSLTLQIITEIWTWCQTAKKLKHVYHCAEIHVFFKFTELHMKLWLLSIWLIIIWHNRFFLSENLFIKPETKKKKDCLNQISFILPHPIFRTLCWYMQWLLSLCRYAGIRTLCVTVHCVGMSFILIHRSTVLSWWMSH